MATLCRTIPPAPATKRGFSTPLHSWQRRLVYCAGTSVFLTSLDDLAECQVYRDHLAPTTCAKFSPNGAFVASGDEAGHLNIWLCTGPDLNTRLSTDLFSGSIKDLAWSEDNQRLVAVGSGLQCYGKVIMTDTGNNLGEIGGHSRTLLTCDFRPVRPFRIVTAGEDFLVNVFNGPPFRLSKSHQHHSNYVNCARFSPDGQRILTVSSDRKVLILAADSGDLMQEVDLTEGHTGSIVACSWTSDSSFVTCGLDKAVKVWSFEGVQQTYLAGTDVGDQQVGLTVCDSTLVSLSLKGSLNLWGNSAFPSRTSLSHIGKISNMAIVENQLLTADFAGNLCNS